MQLVAHGIDLIECGRIADLMQRHADRFLTRVLTEAERRYVTTKAFPVPHVAGRFAAKEAILKVLGTGWRGSIAWTDIEIVNDMNGQPLVTLSGACREIADRRGIRQVLVSITHTENYAAATAMGMA